MIKLGLMGKIFIGISSLTFIVMTASIIRYYSSVGPRPGGETVIETPGFTSFIPPTFTPFLQPIPTDTFTNIPVDTETPLPPRESDTETPVPPTETETFVMPTDTETPVQPTNTLAPGAPTNTFTRVPNTKTNTPIPPTNTPVPATETPIPPTETQTIIYLTGENIYPNEKAVEILKSAPIASEESTLDAPTVVQTLPYGIPALVSIFMLALTTFWTIKLIQLPIKN